MTEVLQKDILGLLGHGAAYILNEASERCEFSYSIAFNYFFMMSQIISIGLRSRELRGIPGEPGTTSPEIP
jgi:hypothetical protein